MEDQPFPDLLDEMNKRQICFGLCGVSWHHDRHMAYPLSM